ncbi:MAG: chorismate synthase [Anaerolineales bacterium]
MLRFLTAGESHGPAVTAILEGMPAGLPLSAADINPDLARRQQGYGTGGRMKIEKDQVQIVGGVMNGQTIGAPIALQVTNLDHVKWQGKAVEPMTAPRPGHADLTGAIKYGYDDLRYSLERASARETTARVAVAAICRKLLVELGITIGSYVVQIGEVVANVDDIPIPERFARADKSDVRCPDPVAAQAMRARIRRVMGEKDTLGGVYEVVALGIPPGLGSHVHWDRKIEARLAAALMSIHANKGVEIGPAFENARKTGTQVHDEIFIEGERLVRRTNRAGGTEGGVTTGQPLVVRAAMKPISTTLTPLQSVDLASGEPSPTKYERSDFCSVPRSAVVGEAMMAFVLADALIEKLGGDSVAEMKPRCAQLRRNVLGDVRMRGKPTVFWD